MPNANTARAYAAALHMLIVELGAVTPVAALDDEASAERIGTWFTARWGACSGATANARLDALRSAAGWWRHQDWITTDPTRRIRRHPRTPDRTRSVGKPDIDALLTGPAWRRPSQPRRLCPGLRNWVGPIASRADFEDLERVSVNLGRSDILAPPGRMVNAGRMIPELWVSL